MEVTDPACAPRPAAVAAPREARARARMGSNGLTIFSVNPSGAGNGISGRADAGVGMSGTGLFGVQGVSSATNGTGVFGWNPAATGTTRAVYGQVSSPNGVAGAFENTAGGNLLTGSVQGVQKFRVSGAGAVYASAYLDLAGNPISSGSGDITGVSAGTGLTGGARLAMSPSRSMFRSRIHGTRRSSMDMTSRTSPMPRHSARIPSAAVSPFRET